MNKFIQIGSNIGSDDFYELVKNLTEKSEVHLIEPNVTLHPELEKCYSELRKFHDIHIHSFGISTEAETVTLNIYDHSGLSSLINRKSYNNLRDSVDIECKTFNQFCDYHHITNIQLLWIDTEGLDYEILYSIDLNSVVINEIIFEYWPYSDDDRNSKYRTGDEFLNTVIIPKYHNYTLEYCCIDGMKSIKLTNK